MECILVSHTHWDREWYRTFQAFRARLIDTIDRVLDLLAADPGYKFLLDGQSIVLEDYLEIRPTRRDDLKRAAGTGRVAIGPWYVQPDSLMPSGEAHVRNLLEGRRVAAQIGPVSSIAYTPDSFGHPGQFPQLFKGFGLSAFVYWRGNGNEIDSLPAEYEWTAPDGSSIVACHLFKGYGNVSALPRDLRKAVSRMRPVAEDLLNRTKTERVLLMNGSDHLLPDPHTGEIAEALSGETGWKVTRGLLEDFVDGVVIGDLVKFEGELLGGRVANLLPGVWSTRNYLKLRNRRCESLLEGWAEPWAALGRILRAPDERPALRLAWRSLLHNQAHDSICGCSQDAVHEQMLARYDAAEEIASETTTRLLERVAGLGPERRVPWQESIDVAVFNPSPHERTDLVRFALDGYPPFGASTESEFIIHPLVVANIQPSGYEAGGLPARLVPALGNRRLRLLPGQQDWEIEFVAEGLPALGYKIFRISPSKASSEQTDEGDQIGNQILSIRASDEGTFTVQRGEQTYTGIAGIENIGDRGDTYDFDPVPVNWSVEGVEVRRLRHGSGIQYLEVERVLRLPAGLTEDRSRSSDDTVEARVWTVARTAPGVDRIDLFVRVDNTAGDHRLRMLFPTGRVTERFLAASTFDIVERSTISVDDSRWIHPAPKTFPSQGWVSANGLTVVAPGLYETEVTAEGTIAITLLRSVGWLSRPDLSTRPGPAGPSLATPGAQCLGTTISQISLLLTDDPRAAREAELGLRAVAAGDSPLFAAGASMLYLEPRALQLSCLKLAEQKGGIVVRVLNPTNETVEGAIRLGFPVSKAIGIRLDETPTGESYEYRDGTIRVTVTPHALVTLLLTRPRDPDEDPLEAFTRSIRRSHVVRTISREQLRRRPAKIPN